MRYTRRNKLCFVLLSLILLPLSGCIMNPIYYLKDLIKLAGIEGSWISDNTPDKISFNSWEITSAESNKYIIRHHTEGPDQYYMTGFLKLKGTLYADAADLKVTETRYDAATKQEVLSKYETGTHNIMKIALRGDTLSIRLMDLDYLDKCIRSKKYTLPYEVYTDQSSDYNTGSTIYVTASTAELQTFLKTSGNDPKLFMKEMAFYRDDPAFINYFSKESWAIWPLQTRNDAPELLKHSKESDAFKKVGSSIIDSLEQAQHIYKPFYFQTATSFLIMGNHAPDSLTSVRYTGYVLNHTREFLHFFTGYNAIAERAMNYWATAVRDAGTKTNTLDTIIIQLKTSCNNCSPKEKQVLSQFVQTIRPDRDAYKAAAQRNQMTDNISVIDAEATPVKVSLTGDPIQVVRTSGDSVYLLTGKSYSDSIAAKVRHDMYLGTAPPYLPISEEQRLDPRTWKGYVLCHGQISPLNTIDPILMPISNEKDPEAFRHKGSVTNWLVQNEAPVCNAFKYIPGEKPNRYYLINYCADTSKILATETDYVPATFRRYIRHYCIPVNYTDGDGNTYTVVVTKSVRAGVQPLAHVLVSHKNKFTVYRVWLKDDNNGASALYCFAQNGYCYLYDRWDGGSGKKEAYLYKFPVTL
ncbi:hypothetical protein [Taibaiella soli]|uniref:Uncharacterized protein n=1 Tax=Taibaiella soli TaxID=1649169 RepID=A0A2W2BAU7_9BACT|nr:hypothetical protein [Taibaiella soli]PZF70756.1 hypothetical protein DN068_21805 [Taibaiella soli]